MNKVIENILTRRSIRVFRENQISEEDLKTILISGSYAPNAMGMQNWKFTAIQNADTLKKVNEAIRETLLSIPVVPETHPYVVSLIEKSQDENADFLYHAQISNEFLTWGKTYLTADENSICSLACHKRLLREAKCQTLELNANQPVDELCQLVLKEFH